MRIAGAALAAACLVLLPDGARSQAADLTRLTCGQLLDLRGVEPERLLVWLHGYYAGAAQRATLDARQIEEAVAAMWKACEGNRELALIGAEARAIFLSPNPAAEVKPPAQPGPAPTNAATPSRPRALPTR
jgi:HdeA/HdeB family